MSGATLFRRPVASLAALAVLAALVAAPAAAAVFTVKLTNGASIETRYRPVESLEDANKIKLITENGNWISLPREIVESISSDFEAKGYGTVLSTTTVVLGWSPNDAPAPGAEAGEMDPTDRLLQYFQARDSANAQQPPPYSVQQFVEPNSQGGIPMSFGSRTTPPIGQPVVSPN